MARRKSSDEHDEVLRLRKALDEIDKDLQSARRGKSWQAVASMRRLQLQCAKDLAELTVRAQPPLDPFDELDDAELTEVLLASVIDLPDEVWARAVARREGRA